LEVEFFQVAASAWVRSGKMSELKFRRINEIPRGLSRLLLSLYVYTEHFEIRRACLSQHSNNQNRSSECVLTQFCRQEWKSG